MNLCFNILRLVLISDLFYYLPQHFQHKFFMQHEQSEPDSQTAQNNLFAQSATEVGPIPCFVLYCIKCKPA